MDNVVSFGGRQPPSSPPQRAPRIRALGVWCGGGKSGARTSIVTSHLERLKPDGYDQVVPWAHIAVRDRALVVYGPDILPPYAGNAANDKEA